MVAVADANSDLPAHAAAGAVTLLVREVRRVVGAVDIPSLGDDPAAIGGEAMEAM
jgi:hypothetical protein